MTPTGPLISKGVGHPKHLSPEPTSPPCSFFHAATAMQATLTSGAMTLLTARRPNSPRQPCSEGLLAAAAVRVLSLSSPPRTQDQCKSLSDLKMSTNIHIFKYFSLV